MGLRRFFTRTFRRAPVEYVLLVSSRDDLTPETQEFMLSVALSDIAPDVLVEGRLPAATSEHPVIRSLSNTVVRDDAHLMEIARGEFGVEFQRLDKETHSFQVLDLAVLLGARGAGTKILVVR